MVDTKLQTAVHLRRKDNRGVHSVVACLSTLLFFIMLTSSCFNCLWRCPAWSRGNCTEIVSINSCLGCFVTYILSIRSFYIVVYLSKRLFELLSVFGILLVEDNSITPVGLLFLIVFFPTCWCWANSFSLASTGLTDSMSSKDILVESVFVSYPIFMFLDKASNNGDVFTVWMQKCWNGNVSTIPLATRGWFLSVLCWKDSTVNIPPYEVRTTTDVSFDGGTVLVPTIFVAGGFILDVSTSCVMSSFNNRLIPLSWSPSAIATAWTRLGTICQLFVSIRFISSTTNVASRIILAASIEEAPKYFWSDVLTNTTASTVNVVLPAGLLIDPDWLHPLKLIWRHNVVANQIETRSRV